MQVLLSGCCNDVIVVGHEDDMMNKNVIFFVGFIECAKDNTSDLPLVEAERSVVGPANQVVGV